MPAKNINLLTQKDFDRTLLGKFLRWSLTYGRYIIVCTEIVVLLAFIWRFSLDRQITDLNEVIEQKSAIIEANRGFEDQFRNLQARVQQIGTLATSQDFAVPLIHHLETITPRGVLFSKFSFSNEKISITATADTNRALSLFLTNLTNSAFLANITVTNLNQITTGVSKINFQVEAVVKSQVNSNQTASR